jgi:hypothetical protein
MDFASYGVSELSADPADAVLQFAVEHDGRR